MSDNSLDSTRKIHISDHKLPVACNRSQSSKLSLSNILYLVSQTHIGPTVNSQQISPPLSDKQLPRPK